MENYNVIKYSSSNYDEWNKFVAESKNATFLFNRDFIDYHNNRFKDFSLLVYNKDKLVSILPANIIDNNIYSHQGLSYGGLILSFNSTFQCALASFYVILKFLFEQKINILFLKQLPKIYHLRPSDELDYLFFTLKGESYRKDVSMVIPLNTVFKLSTLRKRQLKKAHSNDLFIKLETDLTTFWNNILTPNLKKKYKTKPTHSLSEINMLREKFPNNILQYNVYYGDELLAGCTVFETDNVIHLQYIATKKEKNIGALDYLIYQLLTITYKDKDYFDFGTSMENEGKKINEGLLNWKQSFGASTLIHDFYKIDTNKFPFLKKIMI
ncbi:hypothetical protein SAMN05428642_102901 [Flaviramulus basaltis]|uniref:Acetyltransferase (GNAT) domain-containing protein n=1 Tax=Flaviramulus basaltis TaxID=369401 RepID=A0A1K2IK66_9FLAO|nr:GNAT family N-acetyltransferase [Flaviramulus basaltis]SFZ92702.1 hypothetical protein SAMN05428642_102901 [Flaviramulus basaltis]